MKQSSARLLKRFRRVVTLWIRVSGWVTASPVFYYTVTVQKRILNRHKLTTNAAAISFFFLLSIVPLLFVIISIITFVVQSPEHAEQFILQSIVDRVPESAHVLILDLVMKSNLIHNVKGLFHNRGLITVLSIGALLWTSSGAFAAIEDAMSTIFGVKGRNYFISRLVEIGMVLITGSLFMLSNLVTAVLETFKQEGATIFNVDFANLPHLWQFITAVMPYLLTIAMFFIMYKILPKTAIHNRAAALGAVVAGVLLELSIYGFAYYVKHFARYDAFYGSVAGIVITIFSIYLASIILLVGAEVTEIANTKIESDREIALTIKQLQS